MKSAVFYGTVLLISALLYHHKIFANDIWKALYTGRFIALQGYLPDHVQFTFSPTRSTVLRQSFNWLGNVFFYGLHSATGVIGLQLFKYFIIILSVILLHSLFEWEVNHYVFAIFLIFIIGIGQKLNIRNAIFMVPFMLTMWVMLKQFFCDRNIQWLFGLPIIFMLWSNIHGSFLAGWGLSFLVLIGLMVDYSLNRTSISLKTIVIFGLVVVLGFVTVTWVKPHPDPQGYKLIQTMIPFLSSASINARQDYSTSEINQPKTERTNKSWYQYVKSFMQSTIFDMGGFRSGEYSFPLDSPQYLFIRVSGLLLITTIFWIVIDPFSWRWYEITPIVASGLIGMGYIVTVALIPLTIIPIMGIKLRRGDFEELELSYSLGNLVGLISVAFVLFIIYHAFAGSLLQVTGRTIEEYGWGIHSRFSTKVPPYIKKHHPDKRYYNTYNIGSWLIWKWWPEKRVFIDSKSSAYKLDFLRKYDRTEPHRIVK
ncbi:MAG: hypothetical protein ABEJ65_00360, partial [bacterium]